VHPHDSIFRIPTEASRRTALNIQHLLHDESNLDKVADAAAGSYVIEQLSHDLCQMAWALFLQIEEKGGFVAALRSGFIQDQVVASRSLLEHALKTRKRSLVGVSSFASARDKVKVEIQSQRDPLAKLPEIRIVESFREAAVFESLRRAFTMEGNPNAFLAQFGDPAKRSARAGFAAELLSAGGFISQKGDPSVALIDQLHSKAAEDAQVIVLCAADEDYLAAVELLIKDGWPEVPVIIAGKPADSIQLEELGIHDFIYIGCDVAAVLGRLSEEVLH
jgi:methylmalonyl-CoA mutase